MNLSEQQGDVQKDLKMNTDRKLRPRSKKKEMVQTQNSLFFKNGGKRQDYNFSTPGIFQVKIHLHVFKHKVFFANVFYLCFGLHPHDPYFFEIYHRLIFPLAVNGTLSPE